MRHLKNNIPAFSLVEILVVLVLSSIIVGIIYTAYYTVSTYHMQLMRKQRVVEDVSAVFFLMKKDAEKSRTLIANDALSFSCLGGYDKNIHYSFDSLFILRTQLERTDTFGLAIENPLFYFNDKTITTFPAAIDAVEIGVRNMAIPVNIHIFKQYDVASLINLTKKDSLP